MQATGLRRPVVIRTYLLGPRAAKLWTSTGQNLPRTSFYVLTGQCEQAGPQTCYGVVYVLTSAVRQTLVTRRHLVAGA